MRKQSIRNGLVFRFASWLKLASTSTSTDTPLTHSPEQPDHDALDRKLGSRKKIRIGWILGSKKRLPVIEQIAFQG